MTDKQGSIFRSGLGLEDVISQHFHAGTARNHKNSVSTGDKTTVIGTTRIQYTNYSVTTAPTRYNLYVPQSQREGAFVYRMFRYVMARFRERVL